MPKVLISNINFGDASPDALKAIQREADVIENIEKRRWTELDLIEKIHNVNVLIAGTENITQTVMERAPDLKLIARVGVGVNNIDLEYAKERKISISYTPDPPSGSVPEFTLALMLNLLKGISVSDRKMHQKTWHRPMGRMLSSMKIGIVGAGKIGKKVAQLINGVAPLTEILFYDPYVEEVQNARKCTLEELFQICDMVTLHLPLNDKTQGLVGIQLLKQMKQNSYLINTSRGGIVDEHALYHLLEERHLAGAAIDVFEAEPYEGDLTDLSSCLLTSHIGSMTEETRGLMEMQVAEDVLRFINNQSLLRPLDGFNFMRSQ